MKKKKNIKDDDPLAGDLSDYLPTLEWKKVRFIFAPMDTTVTLRLPMHMMAVAKAVAKNKGVKYQTMMREAIADYLVKAQEEKKVGHK